MQISERETDAEHDARLDAQRQAMFVISLIAFGMPNLSGDLTSELS